MWKYIRRYLAFAFLAALFMIGEVSMDLIQPGIMSRIIDEGVLGTGNGGAGSMHAIWALGLQMVCLVLFGGLCGALNNAFVHMTGQNIGNEIRKDCFRKIMAFSFTEVDAYGTGSLVTRVTNDITQVQNLVSQFVRGMIRTTLLTFGSMLCMYFLNRRFGLIALCAFPFLVGTMALCIWKANPLFSRLQAELDRINEVMQEDVSAIRIIKACVREGYEKARFGKANSDLVRTQLRTLMIFAFMNPCTNAIMYLVVFLIILCGAKDVEASAATPGCIMAAITYTTQLLNGILMLVMLFQNISRGMASWKRVRQILDAEQMQDGEFEKSTSIKGDIEFRNVSFGYPGSDKRVLEGINLHIHPGETVAIMGTTGCGKSTLISLIPRFYDASEGEVLVDGVDVREYRQKALMDRIAIAMQKSELFSVSIAENILWGDPEASDERIEKAASVAQADRFIREMEAGYDSIVAERGMSLSGGQKQRVSLARAVIKDAEILILDDATSALDLKTEAELYKALDASKPDCTKIIVAQRIASARRADRIVILDNGRIAASGSHEELLCTCPLYKEIARSQMGEEALA